MFLLRNKKDISIFRMKKVPYLLLCLIVGFVLPWLIFELPRPKISLHIRLVCYSTMVLWYFNTMHKSTTDAVFEKKVQKWCKARHYASLCFFVLKAIKNNYTGIMEEYLVITVGLFSYFSIKHMLWILIRSALVRHF